MTFDLDSRRSRAHHAPVGHSTAGSFAPGRIEPRLAAGLANHTRWHVNQGTRDPRCGHCAAGRSSPTAPTRRAVSYELAARLPDLRDGAGELIAAVELPCAARPDDWSGRAPIETRRRSARICGGCPALASCDELLIALGDAARGVMAGRVLPTPGQRREAPALSSSKT
jgi:hypothetical protein